MATALLSALQYEFVQRLTPGVRDISIRLDPVFQNVIEGSFDLSKDPINQDWKVWYTYTGALAGGLQYSSVPSNNFVLDGTDRANIIDSLPSFPGLQDSSMPSLGRFNVGLASVRGNMYMPFAVLQAQAALPTITDYPALVLKKHIEKVAHLQACAFYADANGGLVQLNSTASTLTDTLASDGHTVTVTPGSASTALITDGRIRRIKPGMYVDIYNSAFSSQHNANGFALIVGVVNNKNYGTASTIKIYFQSTVDAAAFAAGAVSEGSWLTPRGALASVATSKSMLPCGYKSWTIESGTLFGYHGDSTLNDITKMPELMSITASSVGDVTETVLNQYISLFQEARDGDLDTILTSAGVLVNLLDTPLSNNWFQFQRQGEALDLRLGWKGISYTFDGREYTIHQSPFISKGELAVLQTKNGNLRRHYPPRIPGMGLESGFPDAVQWVGPMFGNSIWMPVLNGARVTEGAQAPYLMNMQVTARDPRGILLTGCTDDSLAG